MIVECSSNKAYSVEKYDYQGHTYLSISRMFKKKGISEWQRGKCVAFSADTKEDIEVIRQVVRGIKKELFNKE